MTQKKNRVSIQLAAHMATKLHRIAGSMGVGFSELVRRALADWVEDREKREINYNPIDEI